MRGLRQSSRRPDQRSIYRSETRWSVRSVRTRVKGSGPAKCQHIAGVPLRPETAGELYKVYLTKGVFGTTSIEGNTLTEAEVRARLEGRLKLPKSREYLGLEGRQHPGGVRPDSGRRHRGPAARAEPERIKHFNGLVLRALEVDAVDPICDLPSQFSRLCSRTSTSPGYILSGMATDAPPG